MNRVASFALRWIANTATTALLIRFITGMHPIQSGLLGLIGVALVLGLFNALILPAALLIRNPLPLLWLVTGTVVINAILVIGGGALGYTMGIGFTVTNYLPLVILSFISIGFSMILASNAERGVE